MSRAAVPRPEPPPWGCARSGRGLTARKAVLFITHDLDEAIVMSDRVVVLSAGPAKLMKWQPDTGETGKR